MKTFAFHDKSGCGWYRVQLPLGELQRRGWDIDLVPQEQVSPQTDMSVYKLIIAQRMDKHEALTIYRRWRQYGRLVYEIDDDVFNVDIFNWMAYGTYSRQDVQDAVAHAAQISDLVTVTNEHLAGVMQQYCDNVAILPNCVPDGLITHERPRCDRVTVGWAGGASHSRDIYMIAQPLRRFLDRNKHVDLHLIGTDYGPTIERPRRYTEWSSNPWDYYRTVDFDIGIAPLVDTEFARSKSYIKALEYAALGIPVVASDVGPYREFVQDGVTGFLVSTDHQWTKRLYELANDRDMREEMGREAQALAKEHTISARAHLWEDAYGKVLA